MTAFPHRHLLGIEGLSAADLTTVLDLGDRFLEINERPIKKVPTLRGKTVVNLFLEPSTRTRTSFEIAAKRLSADAINISGSTSSTTKGETTRTGFTTAQPFLELEAAHTSVLASNHITDPHVRDETLQRWSTAHVAPGIDSLAWYERTAAASQSVVTFALLATAAEPTTSPEAVRSVYEAYYPWFAYAVTMLDSWVDRAEDEASGAHSYIAHYTDSEQAVSRLCESAARSAESLLSLPHGQRHAVLLACMIAMYLSKNSVRGFEGRAPARRIAEAGGSLTLCLLPVLRLWRICNGQTDAT